MTQALNVLAEEQKLESSQANVIEAARFLASKRIKSSLEVRNLDWFLTQYKDGKLIFPAFQRNYVWGKVRTGEDGTDTQSLWIHSMGINCPAPSIFINTVQRAVIRKRKDKDQNSPTFGKMIEVEVMEDFYEVIDGQQRLTTSIDYATSSKDDPKLIKGGFCMNDDTPDIEDEEVYGKFFADLSERLRSWIKSYQFSVAFTENLDDATKEMLFQRLNGGMALTKIEKLRAEMGSMSTEFVNKIMAMPLWNTVIQLNEEQQNRFASFETILQTMKLMAQPMVDGKFVGSNVNFAEKKNPKDGYAFWTLQFNQSGFPKELCDEIEAATAYVQEAFSEQEYQYHKKSHMPMILMVALRIAIPNNVPAEKFASIIHRFYTIKGEKPDTYTNASGSKTASASATGSRANALAEYVKFAIDNGFKYKKVVMVGEGDNKTPKVELYDFKPYMTPSERNAIKEEEKKAKAAAKKAEKEAEKAAKKAEKDAEKEAKKQQKEEEKKQAALLEDEEAEKQRLLAETEREAELEEMDDETREAVESMVAVDSNATSLDGETMDDETRALMEAVGKGEGEGEGNQEGNEEDKGEKVEA